MDLYFNDEEAQQALEAISGDVVFDGINLVNAPVAQPPVIVMPQATSSFALRRFVPKKLLFFKLYNFFNVGQSYLLQNRIPWLLLLGKGQRRKE